MTGALRTEAPAKLNLGLRVVGRRADGYHELVTVFCAIDLCDALVARRSRDPSIRLTIVDAVGRGMPVASGDDNLVVRAARSVLAHTGSELGLEFHLLKRIPAGGGLGGGSSDAAAALRLTNALLGAPLGPAELAQLARALGADVPFFLVGGTCLASGIGERLQPIADDVRRSFVLVLPPFGAATARVFELLGARLIQDRNPATVGGDESPTASELALTLLQENDLEVPAMACTPQLRQIRDRVRRLGFADVRMSGSGSTLFVPCPDAESAAATRRVLRGGLDAAVGVEAVASHRRAVAALEPAEWPEPTGRPFGGDGGGRR